MSVRVLYFDSGQTKRIDPSASGQAIDIYGIDINGVSLGTTNLDAGGSELVFGNARQTLQPASAVDSPILTIRAHASETVGNKLFMVRDKDGTEVYSIDEDGDVYIAGGETVVGATTFQGDLSVEGNTQLGNEASDTIDTVAKFTTSDLRLESVDIEGQTAWDIKTLTQATADTAGFAMTVSSGTGGVASASGGGAGGALSVTGGTGGAGTAGLAAGAGGAVTLEAGAAGTDNGGGGADGGHLILKGGTATDGGPNGDVQVNQGNLTLASGLDILPQSDGNSDAGSSGARFGTVYTDTIGDGGQALSMGGASLNIPDDVKVNFGTDSDGWMMYDETTDNDLEIATKASASAATSGISLTTGAGTSQNSGPISLVTGDTGTSGDTGDINLTVGAAAGTAGKVKVSGGHLELANTIDLTCATDGGSDVGSSSVRFGTVYTDTIGDAGQALTVAGNLDATVGCDVSGGNLTIANTYDILPITAGGSDIGSTSAEFGDVYLADDKYLNVGSDQDGKFGYNSGSTRVEIVGAAGAVDTNGTNTYYISGDGGAASGVGGGTGGTAQFWGGSGGQGDPTYVPGAGGAITVQGGTAGAKNGNASGAIGGQVNIIGGTGTVTVGGQSGGDVYVTSGAGSGSGNAGNVYVDGNATGDGTSGKRVYIGTTNAEEVFVGRSGKDVNLQGPVDVEEGMAITGNVTFTSDSATDFGTTTVGVGKFYFADVNGDGIIWGNNAASILMDLSNTQVELGGYNFALLNTIDLIADTDQGSDLGGASNRFGTIWVGTVDNNGTTITFGDNLTSDANWTISSKTGATDTAGSTIGVYGGTGGASGGASPGGAGGAATFQGGTGGSATGAQDGGAGGAASFAGGTGGAGGGTAVAGAGANTTLKAGDAGTDNGGGGGVGGTLTIQYGSGTGSAADGTIDLICGDNLDAALEIKDGDGALYLEVDTQTGSEIINIGNATNNPNVSFLGTGDIVASSGTLDIPAGTSLKIGTVAITTALLTAANMDKLFDGSDVGGLHIHSGLSGAIDVRVAKTSGEAIAIRDIVFVEPSDGKVYKAQADVNYEDAWCYGFATEAAAGADETIDIMILGELSGFAGLTTGDELYVSDTAGGYSASPGTNYSCFAALATSASSVFIRPERPVTL